MENRGTTNCVFQVSSQRICWILLYVILASFCLTCVETKPAGFWNQQVSRRLFQPHYKCKGKLRRACERVASTCHVSMPPMGKKEIVAWLQKAAANIGERAQHEGSNEGVELSDQLINEYREIERENSHHHGHYRVKVSCKRCDILCWAR